MPSNRSVDVEHHEPGEFGDCDGCGSSLKRPTHRIGAKDLCGSCYGEERGYIAR